MRYQFETSALSFFLWFAFSVPIGFVCMAVHPVFGIQVFLMLIAYWLIRVAFD